MKQEENKKRYNIFKHLMDWDISKGGLWLVIIGGLLVAGIELMKKDYPPSLLEEDIIGFAVWTILGLFLVGLGVYKIYFRYIDCQQKYDDPDAYSQRKYEEARIHREKVEEKRRIREEQLQNEYEYAVYSQNNGAPWDKKYMTDPCPYCGHYKVRYSKWEDKQISVAFWGGASDKIGKIYKCENCNRMW